MYLQRQWSEARRQTRSGHLTSPACGESLVPVIGTADTEHTAVTGTRCGRAPPTCLPTHAWLLAVFRMLGDASPVSSPRALIKGVACKWPEFLVTIKLRKESSHPAAAKLIH